MSNFDQAFDVVMGHEGGFVDHQADPGGATNMGISIRYLLRRGDLDGDGLPDGDIDGDGDIDVDDIKAIQPADAKALYNSGFWSPNKLHQVRDQSIAVKIFDICVNTGSKQAWRIVQRACNRFEDMDLLVDGIVGPATLAAVNGCTESDDLLVLIREQQLAFYQQLVADNSDFEVFLDGWTNRAMA